MEIKFKGTVTEALMKSNVVRLKIDILPIDVNTEKLKPMLEKEMDIRISSDQTELLKFAEDEQ